MDVKWQRVLQFRRFWPIFVALWYRFQKGTFSKHAIQKWPSWHRKKFLRLCVPLPNATSGFPRAIDFVKAPATALLQQNSREIQMWGSLRWLQISAFLLLFVCCRCQFPILALEAKLKTLFLGAALAIREMPCHKPIRNDSPVLFEANKAHLPCANLNHIQPSFCRNQKI